MVGLELPVLAMEHHYLMTEPMPEVIEYNEQNGRELPHMIDFAGEIYARQEGQSILLGTYEQNNRPWSPNETPWDFVFQLLPHDLDRIAPELERGFAHFPAVGRAGIQKFVNGPFTFSPDGNPLVGPIKGMRGMWVACAVMAGLSQGGGVGLSLANWMVDGDPRRRHLGHGRRPLRRLGDARLHQRQGARELLAPLPHHVPERRAAGGASAAHHADLRPPHRAQRGVGCRLRARAPAVVPGARRGADRERHVPSLQRVRTGRRGSRGPCASGSACREASNFAKYKVSGAGSADVAAGPVHQHACRRSAAPT